MIIVASSSSCVEKQEDDLKGIIEPTPDYRFQCELDGYEYDYSRTLSYFSLIRGEFVAEFEETKDYFKISYVIYRPARFRADFVAIKANAEDREDGDGCVDIIEGKKYECTCYEWNWYDTSRNGVYGEVGGYAIESCMFSFELPSPEDTSVAYYFIFDMVLRSQNAREPVFLKNGRITIYRTRDYNNILSHIQKVSYE